MAGTDGTGTGAGAGSMSPDITSPGPDGAGTGTGPAGPDAAPVSAGPGAAPVSGAVPAGRGPLARAADFDRGVLGADRYRQYLAFHARSGGEQPPLSEKEYWRDYYRHQEEHPGARCCLVYDSEHAQCLSWIRAGPSSRGHPS